MKKTYVVGGGGGGIASALLASTRGDHVTLFEAHENLGGCASWFDRGPFSFDVGATTLSGMGPGEPLGKLFNLLGERPQLSIVNPGIVFHLSSGDVLNYYKDFDLWMKELERVFPNLNHRPFWKKVFEINDKAWGLLDNLSSFPFTSVEDFFQVLKAPQYFSLYPYLFVSTEMMLKHYNLEHSLYSELLNGILLISAQTEARNLPFLVGAMGLSYPRETFAPVGGMKGFMEFLERVCQNKNIQIMKSAKVEKIEGSTIRLTDGRSFKGDEFILNLPCWNIPALFSDDKTIFRHDRSEEKSAWGAFVVYLGIKAHIRDSYHQIHLNHPLVKNYFASFSLPEDLKRAPTGWQSVTISTHIDAASWFEMEKADYRKAKEEITQLILADFKKRFNIQETKYVTAGTPKTFERYTGRHLGYVGGLPFLFGSNPWRLIGHKTPISNVFRVGDTTFPGQGIVGVVAGALALHQEMLKK